MAITVREMQRRTGLPFLDRLGAFGDRPALVDETGMPRSHAWLDEAITAFGDRLGGGRRLVVIRMASRLDAVVAYLGALRAGHVPLLVGADTDLTAIERDHRPDTIVDATTAPTVERRHDDPAHDLHPDLALLLSTSGSTGSPKLVRLSTENLASNADAIADYLALGPSDRAITTLPLHYCFGLSVLHSHLAAGASVVLTSASVVDPCFWATVEASSPTNLAAVPHTIELLERVGFTDRHIPSLRFVQQAGGKLDPALVRRYAAAGEALGWELFVMYGQTEATARMAYLPPALAHASSGAVGVPIPGGSFSVDPFEGAAPGEGEIVYRGPNVMMGYATTAADLARPAERGELRTGDVGRITDAGLLEITGRRRDFLKLFGNRIDLGIVRDLVRAQGIDAHVDGDDDGLTIAVLDHHEPGAVRELVRDATGLPAGTVACCALGELPRTSTGKVDAPALRAAVRTDVHLDGGGDGDGSVERDATDAVHAVYRRVLGVSPTDDDTFVSLGGDSLSYVEASIALEAHLGHLPDDWHLTPVEELDRAAVARRRWFRRVDTTVVLRAIAIVLIVGNHAGLFLIPGGAHVLVAGAGFNFARFQRRAKSPWPSIGRVVAPAVAWIGAVAAVHHDFGLTHALLLHGWLDGSQRWIYWFVEALVQILVVLAALWSIPAVRRVDSRAPFAVSSTVLAVGLVVRLDLVTIGPQHHLLYRPHEILWLFALGWMAAVGTQLRHRVVCSGVAVALIPGTFDDPLRSGIVLGGLLLLIWARSIPIPNGLHRIVGPLASASLFIYLTHVQVFPEFDRPIAGVVASLVAGVLGWRCWAVLEGGAAAAGRRAQRAVASARSTTRSVRFPPATMASGRARKVPPSSRLVDG